MKKKVCQLTHNPRKPPVLELKPYHLALDVNEPN